MMQVQWYLDSVTQTCLWTFGLGDSRFQVRQSLDEFFRLVDNLHSVCCQLREHIDKGMDPAAAIAEWERMLKEKTTMAPTLFVGLLLEASSDSPEMWHQAKSTVAKMVAGAIGERKVSIALGIALPCGNKLELKTLDDIMALEVKDVPCPCGNPNHFLIKWQVKPEFDKSKI